MITSNGKRLYVLLVLSRVKTRSKISNPIQVVAGKLSKLELKFQKCFNDLNARAKKISVYKNYLTVQLRSFYLTFNRSDISAKKKNDTKNGKY